MATLVKNRIEMQMAYICKQGVQAMNCNFGEKQLNYKLVKQEEAFLDTLDLINIIDFDMAINNNMEHVQQMCIGKYAEFIKANPEYEPDECIFSALTVKDFTLYLCERYDFKYSCETVYFLEYGGTDK